MTEEFFLTSVLLEDLSFPLPWSAVACMAFKGSLPPQVVLRCSQGIEPDLNSPSHEAQSDKTFPICDIQTGTWEADGALVVRVKRCSLRGEPSAGLRPEEKVRASAAHTTPVVFTYRNEPRYGGGARLRGCGRRQIHLCWPPVGPKAERSTRAAPQPLAPPPGGGQGRAGQGMPRAAPRARSLPRPADTSETAGGEGGRGRGSGSARCRPAAPPLPYCCRFSSGRRRWALCRAEGAPLPSLCGGGRAAAAAAAPRRWGAAGWGAVAGARRGTWLCGRIAAAIAVRPALGSLCLQGKGSRGGSRPGGAPLRFAPSLRLTSERCWSGALCPGLHLAT